MEDTFQEGQDTEEQNDKGNIKAEDNAVEMSEDFDGQMHEGDDNQLGNVASSFNSFFVFRFLPQENKLYPWSNQSSPLLS